MKFVWAMNKPKFKGAACSTKKKKQKKNTFDRKTREENKMMWALSQQRVQVIECSDYQG